MSTTDEPDLSKLAKIRALLDKAEATAAEFPDEAEALSAKAIELMERYRIDEAMVADAKPSQDRGRIIELTFSVGSGPYVMARLELLEYIGRAHSVMVLNKTTYNGKMVYLNGYETDVSLTEMLYTSLLVQATSALSSPEVKRSKPGYVHGKAFARSFLLAFAFTIGQRLRKANKAASVAAEPAEGRSVALVLADRSKDVKEDVFKRYGKLRASRPAAGISSQEGMVAGANAGARADIGSNRSVNRSTQKALSS